MLIRVLLLPLRRRWRRPRDPRKPACWRSWSSKRKVSARPAPCTAGGRHRDCSPVRGKHPAPGMQPDSWGRSPALGKHPAPGKQPGSQGHCLTRGGDAALFSGLQPGSGDGTGFPGTQPRSADAVQHRGMQLRSKGRSAAPANAAGFRGTQPRSRERPPARSEGRPFCPRHPNSSESQVSCSPNCACHRALRGHPGITRTAHAFK